MRTNDHFVLALVVLSTLLLLASCTRATPVAVQTFTPGTIVTAPPTGVTPTGLTAQPATPQPPTVVPSATRPPTTDDSRHVYLACYTAHAINPAMLATPSAVEEWSLWDAAARVVPGNNSDVTLLAGGCP